MIATIDHIETAPAVPSPDEKIAELKKTVSASRLSTYLSCRLKFAFRYVLEMSKPKSAALHVGSTVHSVLKAWNKARWIGQPLTLEQLHTEFVKAWTETDEPPEWEAGEETVESNTAWRLLETYVRHAAPSTKPEAVEVPVEADLGKGMPKLVGVLDLVENGWVKDYKTSSTTPNPDKVAHTLEVQTSSYALLYRQNTGKREKGIELIHLVKTKLPKVITTELPPMSEDQEARLHTLVDGYVKGLDNQDFLPSPGLQCSFCEYFQECRAWH
jgi:CRISPR/Cas system-associated exonuclease Cas4 (RecB family)